MASMRDKDVPFTKADGTSADNLRSVGAAAFAMREGRPAVRVGNQWLFADEAILKINGAFSNKSSSTDPSTAHLKLAHPEVVQLGTPLGDALAGG